MILFFIDSFEKKIKFGKVAVTGLMGLGLFCVLLEVQSNITISEYSDYYAQFIKFIKYVQNGSWTFARGRILFDENFWKLIPRTLYPQKPYVYGQVEIANIFFSTESIKAGNTPSFSEFVIPYADWGIWGIVIYFFLNGLIRGILENAFRKNMKIHGYNFNVVFLFSIFFICKPISFSILYVIIFTLFFMIIQKINIHIVFCKKNSLAHKSSIDTIKKSEGKTAK